MARVASKPIRKNARSGRKRRVGPLKASKGSAAHTPIDLYFWPTPNGWKITIMLEECGLPYTVIPVNISKGDQFKPEFLAISPNNRMPAIVDHQGPGGKPISIFESGAILQYLGRKTGKFYPEDERGRVEVEQWLFWQMANLGPKAGEANHFRNYAPEKTPLRHRALQQRDEPDLWRDEHAARRSRIPCRAPTRSPTWRASAGRAGPSATATT